MNLIVEQINCDSLELRSIHDRHNLVLEEMPSSLSEFYTSSLIDTDVEEIKLVLLRKEGL